MSRGGVMVISIVVQIDNEAHKLIQFHRLLRDSIDVLRHTFEIWYVNDGSTDDTGEVVRGIIRDDHRVHLINLSRNYGHQAARLTMTSSGYS
ncbi:MAG: glycosyltransferase [Chloroflexi bacterium]|nr:MAG: glycosyltransferase [Chloroflexota bacterium]